MMQINDNHVAPAHPPLELMFLYLIVVSSPCYGAFVQANELINAPTPGNQMTMGFLSPTGVGNFVVFAINLRSVNQAASVVVSDGSSATFVLVSGPLLWIAGSDRNYIFFARVTTSSLSYIVQSSEPLTGGSWYVSEYSGLQGVADQVASIAGVSAGPVTAGPVSVSCRNQLLFGFGSSCGTGIFPPATLTARNPTSGNFIGDESITTSGSHQLDANATAGCGDSGLMLATFPFASCPIHACNNLVGCSCSGSVCSVTGSISPTFLTLSDSSRLTVQGTLVLARTSLTLVQVMTNSAPLVSIQGSALLDGSLTLSVGAGVSGPLVVVQASTLTGRYSAINASRIGSCGQSDLVSDVTYSATSVIVTFSSSSCGGGLSPGAIAGIVIGGIVLAGVIVVVAVFLVHRARTTPKLKSLQEGGLHFHKGDGASTPDSRIS